MEWQDAPPSRVPREWLQALLGLPEDPDRRIDADRLVDILHARCCSDLVPAHLALARTLDVTESTVRAREAQAVELAVARWGDMPAEFRAELVDGTRLRLAMRECRARLREAQTKADATAAKVARAEAEAAARTDAAATRALAPDAPEPVVEFTPAPALQAAVDAGTTEPPNRTAKR
jgi:hypothetical protein